MAVLTKTDIPSHLFSYAGSDDPFISQTCKVFNLNGGGVLEIERDEEKVVACCLHPIHPPVVVCKLNDK